MITAEQLKDVQQRTEALHRYLNIDQKKIEYEEEQLRTQAPDFWDDPKRAEAQMKKVKSIEKWLKGYEEVRTLCEELTLAVEFFKDDIVSEKEVDADYDKAVKAIEALELGGIILVLLRKKRQRVVHVWGFGVRERPEAFLALLPRHANRGDEGEQALADGLALLLELASTLVERVLKAKVRGRSKQLAHDVGALLRTGLEQPAEVTLGNHDDLRELAAVNPEKLVDLLVNGTRPRDGSLVPM